MTITCGPTAAKVALPGDLAIFGQNRVKKGKIGNKSEKLCSVWPRRRIWL